MPLPKLSRFRTYRGGVSSRAVDEEGLRPYLPPAPEAQPAGGIPDWCTRIARTLNQAIRGNLNVVADVVLTTGSTTVYVDDRIGLWSVILLMPRTATTPAVVSSLWFEPGAGQVTIHHAASADPDRTLRLAIFG